MSHRIAVLLLVLAAACVAPTAQADIVNWAVRGTVTLFTGSTTAIPFDISAGEGYVLTLTLDDDMPAVTQGSVSSLFANGFIESHAELCERIHSAHLQRRQRLRPDVRGE